MESRSLDQLYTLYQERKHGLIYYTLLALPERDLVVYTTCKSIVDSVVASGKKRIEPLATESHQRRRA